MVSPTWLDVFGIYLFLTSWKWNFWDCYQVSHMLFCTSTLYFCKGRNHVNGNERELSFWEDQDCFAWVSTASRDFNLCDGHQVSLSNQCVSKIYVQGTELHASALNPCQRPFWCQVIRLYICQWILDGYICSQNVFSMRLISLSVFCRETFQFSPSNSTG